MLDVGFALLDVVAIDQGNAFVLVTAHMAVKLGTADVVSQLVVIMVCNWTTLELMDETVVATHFAKKNSVPAIRVEVLVAEYVAVIVMVM